MSTRRTGDSVTRDVVPARVELRFLRRGAGLRATLRLHLHVGRLHPAWPAPAQLRHARVLVGRVPRSAPALEARASLPLQFLPNRSEQPVNPFPPVRKIGIQTRSVTGTMPGGNRYESSLERDLMELVRGDSDFAAYHPQPLRIEYRAKTGQSMSYTPDALIFWKSGRRPLLAEVKHREDCRGQWKELLSKLRAARAYARDKGWDFAVFTEDRIRGQRLQNLRFLHGYKAVAVSPVMEAAILAAIRAGCTTPKSILEQMSGNGYDKASALPNLWHLIATRVISIDWDRKLGMATDVHLGA